MRYQNLNYDNLIFKFPEISDILMDFNLKSPKIIDNLITDEWPDRFIFLINDFSKIYALILIDYFDGERELNFHKTEIEEFWKEFEFENFLKASNNEIFAKSNHFGWALLARLKRKS